jgi:hypothetical protein
VTQWVEVIYRLRQRLYKESGYRPNAVLVPYELWPTLANEVAETPAEWTGRYAIDMTPDGPRLLGMPVVRTYGPLAVRAVGKRQTFELALGQDMQVRPLVRDP